MLVEETANHVLATVRDVNMRHVTLVRAKYLVACDGIASGIRASLGVAMQGTPKLIKVLTSPKNCAHILDASPQIEAARRQISAAMKAGYWEPSAIQMGYR